jgi:hypothetical protein
MAGGRGWYFYDCNGNSGYKVNNTRISQTLEQDGRYLNYVGHWTIQLRHIKIKK